MISFFFDGQVKTVKELEAADGKRVSVPVLDRSYSSKRLRKFYSQMYTDGIAQNIKDCFKVSPSTGMSLLIQPGAGMANGAMGIEEQTRTIQAQASHPTLDRIDSVVMRVDDNMNYRNADFYIVQGEASETPVPKPPVRNDSIYEIVVAHVFIARGTTSISAYRITDTRLDSSICGLMQPKPNVDTTGIFSQYQSALDEFLDTVKQAIDGTLAGNLQTQIDDLGVRVTDIFTKSKKTLKEVDETTTQGSLVDAMAMKELHGELTEDLSQYFTVNFGWTINRSSFKRVGDLVSVIFTVHPTEGWSVNKLYTVFKSTLPEKYKPKISAISCGVGANGDLTNPTICAFIAEDKTGDIQIIISDAGAQGKISGYFSCNMMYTIKGE